MSQQNNISCVFSCQSCAKHFTIHAKKIPSLAAARLKDSGTQLDNCNLLHNAITLDYKHIFQLLLKYHQNPVSLTLLSTRKIRQLMNNITRKKLEQLNLSEHLKSLLLSK